MSDAKVVDFELATFAAKMRRAADGNPRVAAKLRFAQVMGEQWAKHRAQQAFAGRGFSDRTIKALVDAGYTQPEQLLSLEPTTLSTGSRVRQKRTR